ncbi:hypothetical protein BV898_12774 [Hypsibius exemplaris]|uniref:Uncharacterized protein n=1 Tax=Hypsibius exemplaris TaxID=2072580 RepID=A0A1W0WCL6_HYPEX|nr:hypothetical protein BV898_12774 [Hypsibius exemplaris]
MDPPSEYILLDYEKEIFLDCFHDDGLLVMAKGLGLERIFLSSSKFSRAPGPLVSSSIPMPMKEEYFHEEYAAERVSALRKSSIRTSP